MFLQGTLTAHFGYRNDKGVVVTIPYGTKNSAPRDTFGTRPTAFFPGAAHMFSAAIDFAPGQSAVWTLSPDNNPTTTLTATSTSPRCTSAQQGRTEAALACRSFRRSSCPQIATYAECSENQGELAQLVQDFLPAGVPAQSAFLNCVAKAGPGASLWLCNFALPTACFDEFDTHNKCLFNGGP